MRRECRGCAAEKGFEKGGGGKSAPHTVLDAEGFWSGSAGAL